MKRDARKRFAKKELGQNFLVDDSVIGKIVGALDLSPEDTVVEIGPGRGALTAGLTSSGAKVIAVELDRELAPMLAERFSDAANFAILEADATEIEFSPLLGTAGKAKLAANLPYYISTAILQHLIGQRDCFSSLVLMFQREVVDRITAEPGNSDRGYLTVIVESAFSVEKLFEVPPEAFRPRPKVWSSVVKLTPKSATVADSDTFRALVSAAFAQKRKTILNNLKNTFPAAAESLNSAQIEPTRRAETLTLEEWERLLNAFRATDS